MEMSEAKEHALYIYWINQIKPFIPILSTNGTTYFKHEGGRAFSSIQDKRITFPDLNGSLKTNEAVCWYLWYGLINRDCPSRVKNKSLVEDEYNIFLYNLRFKGFSLEEWMYCADSLKH